MIKGMTGIKMIETDTCIECGAKCHVVMVARTKHTKKINILTGMVWICENGHTNRTRNHTCEPVKKQ